MKNYKEVAESVFERSNAILEQKNRRRKTFKRIAMVAAPCCLVAVMAVAANGNELFGNNADEKIHGSEAPIVSVGNPETTEVIEVESEATDDDTVMETSTGWGYGELSYENNTSLEENTNSENVISDNPVIDVPQESEVESDIDVPEVSEDVPPDEETSEELIGEAYTYWNGKWVYLDLAYKLETGAADDLITVSTHCFLSEDDYDTYGFLYNGKTLTELMHNSSDDYWVEEKLKRLLEVQVHWYDNDTKRYDCSFGESIACGEMLYTTGTPWGEKWHKKHYDDTVAFYGEEFLAKYIVGGVFDAEKAESDLLVARDAAKLSSTEYEDAILACEVMMYEKEIDKLAEMGINAEISDNQRELVFTLTIEQFEAVEFSDAVEWDFDEDREDGDCTIEMPECIYE